jgi:hypothetical protein
MEFDEKSKKNRYADDDNKTYSADISHMDPLATAATLFFAIIWSAVAVVNARSS